VIAWRVAIGLTARFLSRLAVLACPPSGRCARNGDAQLARQLDHPSVAAVAIHHAELVLDRRTAKWRSAWRTSGDRGVAQAEVLDLPLLLQLGERREAVLERRLRVVGVQQQHEDALDAERREAALDHLAQVIAAAVRDPAALRAREAGLGDHADLLARPAPAGQRGADQRSP
jgi:hypothetical protein